MRAIVEDMTGSRASTLTAATATAPRVRPRQGSTSVRFLLALGVVGVLGMWWFSVPPTFTSTPGNALTSVGELSGMVGAFLVCAQVLLIARVPWFERAVGLDKLVSWHRVLGTSVVLLVVTHVVFIVLGSELTDGQWPWSEFLAVLRSFPDMITALVGTIAFLLVGVSSARLVRAMLSYEVWYWLHLTTYAAIFLTFFHQLSGGAHFVDNAVNRALWIILYLGTAASVLTWRFIVPTWDAWLHRMRVDAVVPESDGVASVWLSGPRVGEIGVQGGNFLLFRFLAWGHLGTAHPYSVSRLPSDGRLRITVGALGDHSRRLHRLRPGTLVFAEGPFGHFTADRASRAHVLLIAGGAGIGPVRALAESLVSRGVSPVVLYRVSRATQLALIGELRELPGVTVVPLVGRRAELGYDPLSPASLRRIVPNLKDWEAFICGPEGMAEVAQASLRKLGMPNRFIHREELSMS